MRLNTKLEVCNNNKPPCFNVTYEPCRQSSRLQRLVSMAHVLDVSHVLAGSHNSACVSLFVIAGCSKC